MNEKGWSEMIDILNDINSYLNKSDAEREKELEFNVIKCFHCGKGLVEYKSNITGDLVCSICAMKLQLKGTENGCDGFSSYIIPNRNEDEIIVQIFCQKCGKIPKYRVLNLHRPISDFFLCELCAMKQQLKGRKYDRERSY